MSKKKRKKCKIPVAILLPCIAQTPFFPRRFDFLRTKIFMNTIMVSEDFVSLFCSKDLKILGHILGCQFNI